MIKIFLENKNVAIDISRCSPNIFSKSLSILKRNNGRYNSSNSLWYFPWYKYKDIKEELEDIDELNNKVTNELISKIIEGNPEQRTEEYRRSFDNTLMNFPPMKGKSPNEDFQKTLITRGINTSRYYYALGMGSGKSYIASAIIAHRYGKYRDCNKILLLTTSIGVRNLYHELLKFIKGLKEEDIVIADKNFREPFESNASIVICSYNSFRLVCEHYKKKLGIKSRKPQKEFLPIKEWSDGKAMLLLDESHEVSHSESIRSHYVSLHSKLFEYRYLFSGTPADKPEKLYNQFKILDPWLVYNLSFTDWKNKMAVVGTYFSKFGIREWKKEELEEQNKRFLKSHGVYYKTLDLIDLPSYNEKKIYLDMSPVHKKIYQSVVTQDIPSVGSVKEVMNRFPFLSLAVDNPILLEKHEDKFDKELNKSISSFREDYLEKFKAMDDIISDNEDEQILIWAIHPKTIEMLGKRYSNLNPICITGETEQDERFELVEKFKNDKSHKLLIANIFCLNTSVTITTCKIQVYMERAYSYSAYSQSTQRIYRLGQDSDVTTYILLYNKSIDVFLDKNLDSKGTLVDGLVNKNFLTQEQWIKIFNMKESDNSDF